MPTAVIEHWDGTSWNVVPSPSPNRPGNNGLAGVAAVSANDIWGVGHQLLGPFTEHWDGISWSIAATPGGVNLSVMPGQGSRKPISDQHSGTRCAPGTLCRYWLRPVRGGRPWLQPALCAGPAGRDRPAGAGK